jgi:hypothetical protein
LDALAGRRKLGIGDTSPQPDPDEEIYIPLHAEQRVNFVLEQNRSSRQSSIFIRTSDIIKAPFKATLGF